MAPPHRKPAESARRLITWPIFKFLLLLASRSKTKLCSLVCVHPPTISVELKFPGELNSFSDASRVCEPVLSHVQVPQKHGTIFIGQQPNY